MRCGYEWWMDRPWDMFLFFCFLGEIFHRTYWVEDSILYHIPQIFSCSFFVEVHICDLFLQKTYHSQCGSHVENPT